MATKKKQKPKGSLTEQDIQRLQEKAVTIFKRLREAFPDARLTLNYETPFQLLIATILAARSPDKRVNEITPDLFKRFPDARAFANASVEEIDVYIQRLNMHRTKAERIKQVSEILVREYDGEVPPSMEALTALPGIGRKTANVVLGNAMNIVEGLEVDQHIARVAYRLGLTRSKNPEKVEQDLMQLLPKEYWVPFTHVAKELGRTYCRPKNPKCDQCPVNDLCERQGVENS